MNQADFRHRFIDPIHLLIDLRERLENEQIKYCKAGNCHEARAAVKQKNIINKKIKVLIGKSELGIMIALPEAPEDSILKKSEEANAENNLS